MSRPLIILFLAADIAAVVIYSLQNHATLSAVDLGTSLDQALPVLPIFIIPYLLFLPFYFGTLIYSFYREKRFIALSTAHLVIYLTAAVIFTVQQTMVAQPEVTGTDIFSKLLLWLYSVDPPYNAFPSLHVAASIVVASYFAAVKSKLLPAVILLVVIVIPSTVLLKQHNLVDIFGGIVLGGLASFISFRLIKN